MLRLCRGAVATRDQVLSGAEEDVEMAGGGRYGPLANNAVPLRVLGWRRWSFQWVKLVGGAAGEGSCPSCRLAQRRERMAGERGKVEYGVVTTF